MPQARQTFLTLAHELVHRLLVLIGAVGLTLVFFLVLPLMQTISQPPDDALVTTSVDVANIPPPPPPPEDEPEEEEEPEEEPPELEEELQQLDLSQLEIALNTTIGDAMGGGDFRVDISNVVRGAEEVESLFSMADLDQKPRVIYQQNPTLSKKLQRAGGGTVRIIFIVDTRGRVTNAQIQKSTNPAYNRAALDAVEKWKFEPGKRNGKPVRFRMRVPITFPKE